MSEQEFAPGDVVRLKAGGPAMTVERRGGARFLCVWFDGNRQLHREIIEAVNLVPATPDPWEAGKA